MRQTSLIRYGGNMKVQEVIKWMERLKPDEEIYIQWLTKDDVLDLHPDLGDSITDKEWEFIYNQLGDFINEDLDQAVIYVMEERREDPQ